ncbi:MAG: hypothetical protein JRI70_09320 [Deltaproteobacteria bacterium]|nr:hypothetical protein [Deltaproteobacteria bacterium]MBW2172523.1 hypothetical protein [Deltaproteobacteria bacterium]
MKTRRIINGVFVLVSVLALMGLSRQVFASAEDQQPEPSIKILRAMTLNDAIKPQRAFRLWHPVVFGIEYRITGEENTWYQVKGIVNVSGWQVAGIQTRRPGVYRMFTGRLVPGDIRPGEMAVRYMVKLGEGGELLDEGTATSLLTVLPPNPNLGYLRLVEKDPDDGSIVEGGGGGLLRYTQNGRAFFFHFDAHGLSPGDSYTLVYLPEPWPHHGLICLGEGTADEVNHVRIVGAPRIKGGLPAEEYDLNAPKGAAILLVRSDDVDCYEKMMLDWKPEDYLFGDSLIMYEDGIRESMNERSSLEPRRTLRRLRRPR